MSDLGRVRCKFNVGTVKSIHDREGKVQCIEVELYAVYDEAPDSENRKFWNATPTGRMAMTINNTAAFGFFHVGDPYYIDLTPAEVLVAP